MIDRNIENYTEDEQILIDAMTQELNDNVNYAEELDSDTTQRIVALALARENMRMEIENKSLKRQISILTESLTKFTGCKI